MQKAPVNTEKRAVLVILEHPRQRARNRFLTELREDDFWTKEGIEIFKRMLVLARHGKDLGGVASFVEDPTLSVDAREFLTASPKQLLSIRALTPKQLRRILDILHDHRKGRALFTGTQKVAELCTGDYTPTTFREAEEAILETLKAIREDRDKKITHLGRGRTQAEILEFVKQRLKYQKNQFITTGLKHLDKHIGGFQRGDLVVISATRGGGKTAMLLQMAINQFRAGYNIGIASLEMDKNQLYTRLMANVTDTKFAQMRTRVFDDEDKEHKRIYYAWKRFEYGTAQKYGNRLTPWDIKDPRYIPENLELDLGPFGYDIIYVDYLSLFSRERQDMWAAQKDHSRYLKHLGGRLNPKPVIVLLTQLSKEERVKYGTGPEEDADWWLWWRYGDEEAASNRVELRLDKARHGKRGIIPAKFRLSRMQIETVGKAQLAMSKYSKQGTANLSAEDVERADTLANWEKEMEELERQNTEPRAPKRKKQTKQQKQEQQTKDVKEELEDLE